MQCSMFAEAFARKFDAIGVVNEAIQNSVCDRGISNHIVPVVHGDLAGNNGRALLVAILDNLKKIASLLVAELLRPPIVQDEKIGFGQALEHLCVTTVASCQGKRAKEPWYTVIGDGKIFSARLVAEGASQPTFADAGRPDQ